MLEDLLKSNLKPKTVEECWVIIDKLINIIQGLEERIRINSQNSSQPPSKDYKKPKAKISKKSKRKPGGQLGHKGVSRKLKPIEQVNQVFTCLPPNECINCLEKLTTINKIIRHQVYELPKADYEITEYQICHGTCPGCHRIYSGSLPESVGKRGFGPRAHSIISLLTTKFKQSKRQALALLQDLYGMPISVGSISNIEHRISLAIEPLSEQIKTQLSKANIINIDETGFKQQNTTGWAWIMANKELTYLHLAKSRGKKIANSLIGDFSNRIIISDRYPAYNYLPSMNHQICWAHLKRDFTKIAQRPLLAGVIGRRLLRDYGRIFGFWKALQINNFVNDKTTMKKRRYLRNCLIRHLSQGLRCKHTTTERTCSNILDQGSSLFLFLENSQVPATNNLAEQQLRPLVIARKLSFGVKSERGARFIERTFSLAATCKQQQIDILSLLQNTIANYFSKLAPPAFI